MTADRARRRADQPITGVGEVARARQTLLGLHDEQLDAICRRHEVRLLTLFGSAADPDVDEPGDLDIGVMFEPGRPHDLLGLLDELITLLGTEEIDLLDVERASETARRRAIADGVGLYEREPMALANASMAADAMFMETEHMRRRALDSLLS